MKKIITLLVVFATAGMMQISAQTQVPNGTFENWVNANAPTSWSSVSMLGISNCFQATGVDAHAGTYAAKLKTTDTIVFAQPIIVPGLITIGTIDIMNQTVKGGIACTDKPDELRGWYKYAPQGGDTMNLIIYFWKTTGGVMDTAGSAQLEVIGAVSTYTAFNLAIDWDTTFVGAPDSCNIVLTNCGLAPHANTLAFYDDLSFYYASAGLSVSLNELMGIYPNPAKDQLNVPTLAGAQLSVYNLNGKLMYQQIAESEMVTLDLQALPRGMYLLQQTNESGSYTSKFILE